MAITTNAITNSFKEQTFQGIHNFSASGGDVFKLALYSSAATIGAASPRRVAAAEDGGDYSRHGGRRPCDAGVCV